MYSCVTEGCPDEGATIMTCKVGYKLDAPLCSLCDEGYFKKLGSCVHCDEPMWNMMIGMVLIVGIVTLGLVHAVLKHKRFLSSTGVFTYLKILVAFVTISTTIDKQYGVVWPKRFQQALAALQVLTFDIQIFGGMMCVWDFSFYDSLLWQTLALVFVVLVIALAVLLLRMRLPQDDLVGRKELQASAMFVGVYFLAFSYPVISVKVVEAFACHEVNGVPYLRADYAVECYTSRWTLFAAYASVFITIYVVGFPFFVVKTLWSYRSQLRDRKIPPEGLLLGFLMDDYKLATFPCYMWEAEEMIRKLLLSIVGAFFSSKSVVVIGSALVVSMFFQVLHSLYYPFKGRGFNQVQQICLTVLNVFYICGLLMKTAAVSSQDSDDIGVLLCSLLALAGVSVLVGVCITVADLTKAFRRMANLARILRVLPQGEEVADDTPEFYSIQIPVEADNMAGAFEAKQPPISCSAESKLKVVALLTDENALVLDRFFHRARTDVSNGLVFVQSSAQVDSMGKVCAKYNRKTRESILLKAKRPAILAKNPQYDIEHIRDTFRFKAVVYSFRDAIKFMLALHHDANVCPSGLCKASVAKLDIAKLREPKEWGWRFIAFDLIMPNHQIVENYIVFNELERTKKEDVSDAMRCKELSNHEIFERWRTVDTRGLTEEREREYQADLKESNRRYRNAFDAVLSHTPKYELDEFWLFFELPASVEVVEVALHRIKTQAALHMKARKTQAAANSLGTVQEDQKHDDNQIDMDFFATLAQDPGTSDFAAADFAADFTVHNPMMAKQMRNMAVQDSDAQL
jgi:hypothetical protein